MFLFKANGNRDPFLFFFIMIIIIATTTTIRGRW
jgi:hypothetical protein